jgi:hypothetical protein
VKDEDGEIFMTHQDFFQALTPYNYQEPKDNKDYFEKNKDLVEDTLRIAISNEEGYISFNEFYFFVLMCQMQDKVYIKEFQKNKGKMNAKKLAKAIYTNKTRTNF